MAEEVALAFAWLTSTLQADTALQGFAPGGVSRTFAQPKTVTPYIVMTFQAGTDSPVFGGYSHADLFFEVMAVGPASDTASVVNAAGRIKTLLFVDQYTAVSGGAILDCHRTQPMESDPLVDGEQWTGIGGVYLVRAKAS